MFTCEAPPIGSTVGFCASPATHLVIVDTETSSEVELFRCERHANGLRDHAIRVNAMTIAPRSQGGDLPVSRRCFAGQHDKCPGKWTRYPDESGTCQCQDCTHA